MVTIRQIAERAGVSKSTVSLALRGNATCSGETIGRISRIAEEMGYRPNPLVSANMAHMRLGTRRKNVQSILAYFYDQSRGSPYELNSFKAANKQANELGFVLEPFPYNDPKLKPDRLYQILRSRNVHGIIIGESRSVIPHIDFKWDEFAVVAIGYTLQSPRVDRIGFDHAENLSRLFHSLKLRNYERVGLALRSDFDDRITHLPTAGYLRFQFELSLEDPLPIHIEKDNWNKASFFKWFDLHKPDCVITVGNEVGNWLASENVKIPEDVGVFSIWGEVEEQPQVHSHFNVSLELLSKTAVDVISDQLNSNSRGVPQQRRSILISGELVERNSLRPVET